LTVFVCFYILARRPFDSGVKFFIRWIMKRVLGSLLVFTVLLSNSQSSHAMGKALTGVAPEGVADSATVARAFYSETHRLNELDKGSIREVLLLGRLAALSYRKLPAKGASASATGGSAASAPTVVDFEATHPFSVQESEYLTRMGYTYLRGENRGDIQVLGFYNPSNHTLVISTRGTYMNMKDDMSAAIENLRADYGIGRHMKNDEISRTIMSTQRHHASQTHLMAAMSEEEIAAKRARITERVAALEAIRAEQIARAQALLEVAVPSALDDSAYTSITAALEAEIHSGSGKSERANQLLKELQGIQHKINHKKHSIASLNDLSRSATQLSGASKTYSSHLHTVLSNRTVGASTLERSCHLASVCLAETGSIFVEGARGIGTGATRGAATLAAAGAIGGTTVGAVSGGVGIPLTAAAGTVAGGVVGGTIGGIAGFTVSAASQATAATARVGIAAGTFADPYPVLLRSIEQVRGIGSAMITEATERSLTSERPRVYWVGHSLGGYLSTVAASLEEDVSFSFNGPGATLESIVAISKDLTPSSLKPSVGTPDWFTTQGRKITTVALDTDHIGTLGHHEGRVITVENTETDFGLHRNKTRWMLHELTSTVNLASESQISDLQSRIHKLRESLQMSLQEAQTLLDSRTEAAGWSFSGIFSSLISRCSAAHTPTLDESVSETTQRLQVLLTPTAVSATSAAAGVVDLSAHTSNASKLKTHIETLYAQLKSKTAHLNALLEDRADPTRSQYSRSGLPKVLLEQHGIQNLIRLIESSAAARSVSDALLWGEFTLGLAQPHAAAATSTSMSAASDESAAATHAGAAAGLHPPTLRAEAQGDEATTGVALTVKDPAITSGVDPAKAEGHSDGG